jgi:hypothetical protein
VPDDEDARQRDGQLQEKTQEEDRRGHDPGHVPGVRQPFKMLLAHEAERGERREPQKSVSDTVLFRRVAPGERIATRTRQRTTTATRWTALFS